MRQVNGMKISLELFATASFAIYTINVAFQYRLIFDIMSLNLSRYCEYLSDS